MFLWRIFLVKPFAALSILLCLATLLACIWLQRRRSHQRMDRFLIAALGLLSTYQGLRILQVAGFVDLRIGAGMDDAIESVVAAFYLMSALVLRFSSMKQLDAESALRLACAAPPRSSSQIEPPRDSPIESLSWGLPVLSDGAFKLFAFLCVRAHDPRGRLPATASEFRSQLGKTEEEVDTYLVELQSCGAVTVRRDGPEMSIELTAQKNRAPHQRLQEFPRDSITVPTGSPL